MQASIFCPYCHRYTLITPAPMKMEGYGVLGPAYWFSKEGPKWWIGICNYCQKPVLSLEEGILVFPHPSPHPTDERIPEDIKNDLDEAKICFSVKAYRASAVISRRAMQSAWIDKGATKEKLVEQLHELAANRVITNDLKEWADVVRWVENDAAHPDKQPVTEKDAEDMLKLSEQFLHVIYVAPAIAKEQRTKRGK